MQPSERLPKGQREKPRRAFRVSRIVEQALLSAERLKFFFVQHALEKGCLEILYVDGFWHKGKTKHNSLWQPKLSATSRGESVT